MNNIKQTTLMKKSSTMQALEIIDENRAYVLNGISTTLEEFVTDNEDTLEQWELILIASLDIGEFISFGGGASKEFKLVRMS